MTIAYSKQMPQIGQYDDNSVAVPINITVTKDDPMGGDPQTGYEYEQILTPLADYVDQQKLACVKGYLTLAIKEKHAAILLEGCQTSKGFRVDIKPENVLDWSTNLQLLQLAGATTTMVCDFNNDKHTLTPTEYSAMCLEIGAYVSQLRAQKWAIRDAINASGTIEQAYGSATWLTS